MRSPAAPFASLYPAWPRLCHGFHRVMGSLGVLLYVFTVLAVGSFVLWRSFVFLGSIREGRLSRLAMRLRFDPVPTATPLLDPRAVAQERGAKSIERHFSVMKRVLVPLIVCATGLLAAVPVLAGTSASAASLVGGALAVLLGLAARPFLENAIAGLVISASGLVRIGDTVCLDDIYGTVEDITATHTAIKVWDWRRYLLPNSTMLQRPFLNYSLFDTYQWAHVDFWVSPDADLDAVRALAIAAAADCPSSLKLEPPYFWIAQCERDAVLCTVAVWAATATDAWSARSSIREQILRNLKLLGVRTMLRHHEMREAGSSVRP